jgi:cytochrome c peroxidase
MRPGRNEPEGRKGMLQSVHISTLVLAAAGFGLALACSAAPEDAAITTEIGQVKEGLNFASATATCTSDPRVQLGIVSQSVCVGAELFFRDEFGGNGRSCASCHPADNNYTIDPTFIAQLPNSDPLFVAEQVPALAGLERPDLMRDFGLILENVDGAETPTTKFTMRSVPHCLSLSRSITPPVGTTTPPLERTGWSGDGAPNQGRLKDFQTGAIFQHYTQSLGRVDGTDFVQATASELDAIDAFLKTIGRSNELNLTAVSLTDSGAESGRTAFLAPTSRCNGCHNNAGANLASGVNQNFDTGVERLRIADLNTQGIPFDGGFGGQGLSSFNFDANKDGINDSFGNGQFNTPPLIEAADTGPFFHTNAFETIEDAIAFYTTTEFAQSPAGQAGVPVVLTSTQIADIGRFLRVLNASFNVQMAIARVNSVLPIIIDGKNQTRDLQQELARLALVEVDDALEVLSAKSALNTSVQASLSAAKGFLATASTHASHTQRRRAAEDALPELQSAKTGLGTGMDFTMGQGVEMF